MSFEQLAQQYFDKNLIVVPITPGHKAPLIKNWNEIDFEQSINKYKGFGIGIKPGLSGLMALDIDIEDPEKKEKIKKLLPPIYCGRIGNKNRLPTVFFKYDEKFIDIKEAGIELIINARQCVLPPTMHPLKYPYEWIGISLLDADLDLIPELDKTLLNEILAIASDGHAKEQTSILPSDGSRCNHGSHNKLSDILIAMLKEGRSVPEISERLIEYDKEINPTVSYFQCPSRKWKTNSIEYNCLDLIMGAFRPRINTEKISMPMIEQKIEFIGEQSEKRERMKLPKLRGIAQDMFSHIYENSPVPRSQFAFASAVTTISVILGNKIRLGPTYPNLYSLMLAPSGFGKDTPIKFPNELLYESNLLDLIGEGSPSSDTGIIMNLPHQRVRLDVIDEADKLFSALNSTSASYLSKMADVYAELYTSSGKFFAGKNTANKQDDKNRMGNTGGCHSPYVSILGAMTIKAFNNSFTPDTIEKGLGGRFLYFIEEKQKRSKEISHIAQIPQEFATFANMWRGADFGAGINLNEIPDTVDPMLKVMSRESRITEGALRELSNAHAWVEDEKLKNANTKAAPMYNRAYSVIRKMALIDACSTQYDTTDITVEKRHVVWAQKFAECHLNNMFDFIDVSISENVIEKTSNKLYSVIRKHTDGICATELGAKTRWLTKNQRKSMLDDLVESGMVKVENETNKETKRKKTTYKTA